MRSLFAAIALLAATAALSQNLPLERIKLPPGFRIEVLAQVPNARSLALGAKGTLFVGSRSGGTVHAVLPDRSVVKVAEGLSMPNGVAFRDGALYIAEVGRIYKLAGVEDRLNATGMPELVFDKLPRDVHHGWKFIRFGPDGKLYVPIGAPCNVCNREGYALLGSLDLKTKEFQPYARGIRNTVGFDWDPATRELWFTDNGRDWLGDDRPADELMFPAQYRNQIFIAEHGSWNRSKRIGYRISLVKVEHSKVISYETFAEGWLQGDSTWGRPVDVEVLPDGSLAVSDDSAGVIYRISYAAPK